MSNNKANTADPDLAGPGVLLALILNSMITFLAGLAVQKLRRVEGHMGQTRLSRIESWINRMAKKSAPQQTLHPLTFWISTLEQFTRGLSDQQLITSPLLLLVAFVKYIPSSDNINMHIAMHASYFSMVAHLASMRILESYLKDHQMLSSIRFAVIYCTLLLSAITQIPILLPLLLSGANFPDSIGLPVSWAMIMSWFYLLVNATFSIHIRLLASGNAIALRDSLTWSRYCPPEDNVLKWAREYQPRLGKKTLEDKVDWACVRYWRNCYQSTQSEYMIMVGFLELILPWHVLDYILGISFLNGLVILILDMIDGKISNEWGFGQILPLALLLLPLFTLMENYADQAKENRAETVSNTPSTTSRALGEPKPALNRRVTAGRMA